MEIRRSRIKAFQIEIKTAMDQLRITVKDNYFCIDGVPYIKIEEVFKTI